MLDITAIAQSSPGAIAVNAAIIVGWKVQGTVGMVVAVIGTIIPPIIILSVISLIYSRFISNQYVSLVLKGMQAGVAAVILDVVCSLGSGIIKEKQWINYAIMLFAFIATFCLGINVVYIILTATAAGVAKEIVSRKRKGGK